MFPAKDVPSDPFLLHLRFEPKGTAEIAVTRLLRDSINTIPHRREPCELTRLRSPRRPQDAQHDRIDNQLSIDVTKFHHNTDPHLIHGPSQIAREMNPVSPLGKKPILLYSSNETEGKLTAFRMMPSFRKTHLLAISTPTTS
jgi:hypothetical protein